MNDGIGKLVAGRRYFHTSVLPSLGEKTVELLAVASSIAGAILDRDFNVVRMDLLEHTVALLSYPSFFAEAFPSLARSWKVDLKTNRAILRNYENSFNPPVLHRKELLLKSDDTRRAPHEQLTAELESQGLFDDPVRIGFKLQWEKLLAERGFRVTGHQLVPVGNEEPQLGLQSDKAGPFEIARHLTALTRQNFSAPIQILQRFGFLDGAHALFDYGCGKGDDVRGLVANGITATGWDPYFAPSEAICSAHLINLGFVINVIEDPVERREALQRAFSLAHELLVVSTMVATENPGKVTLFGDGVLTSRSTFQKYYTQSELREYLSATLGEEPISVAPGIFFVFKDKDAEQRFETGRYRGRIRIQPLSHSVHSEGVIRERRVRPAAPDRYEAHRALLDPLWSQCLELGREPDETEVSQLPEVEQALGSLKRALRLVLARNDSVAYECARRQRTDDLRVYFALQQFQRRKPYRHLEPRLQRDVRAFFGDYVSAQEHARHLLYQLAQPEILDKACRAAAEQGLGWLEESHSLQLHSSLIPRLPAPLRAYVGCASVLYGDATSADLVKIHIRSGKVSFMKYDDFYGSVIPKMTERTKINLRTLDFQLFTYGGEYPCPPLYLKSRYINEEFLNYAEQLAFDQLLESLRIVNLSGFGPTEADFYRVLKRAHLKVEGFCLERDHFVPKLDDPCGKYFTFRQLIECGETQTALKLKNLPTNPESYTALYELATNILDPVIEYFGGIELTYGFCSLELEKHIRGRVAPELDQHAAHERRRTGKPVCSRLGAAVDFLVRDENMREVAHWIQVNLPFDRLYYYGPSKPLHVSYGPEKKRESIEMIESPSGRRIPRPL